MFEQVILEFSSLVRQDFFWHSKTKKEIIVDLVSYCFCWLVSYWVGLCILYKVLSYNKQVFIPSAAGIEMKKLMPIISVGCVVMMVLKGATYFWWGDFSWHSYKLFVYMMTYCFFHTWPKYPLCSQKKYSLSGPRCLISLWSFL